MTTTPEPAVEAGERDPATVLQEIRTKSLALHALRKKIASPGGSNQGTAFALQRTLRERQSLLAELPPLRLVPSPTQTDPDPCSATFPTPKPTAS